MVVRKDFNEVTVQQGYLWRHKWGEGARDRVRSFQAEETSSAKAPHGDVFVLD